MIDKYITLREEHETEAAKVEAKSGIGDIESNSRGTAARYNSGKCRLDLLPLYMVVSTIDSSKFTEYQKKAHFALSNIAMFQRTGSPGYLMTAMETLSDHWKDCADVFEYGAKKYASWNWVKGMKWSVPIGCIARHTFAIYEGEEKDSESGLPHIGHVLCNIVMLMAYAEGYPEGNDLPPREFRVNE